MDTKMIKATISTARVGDTVELVFKSGSTATGKLAMSSAGVLAIPFTFFETGGMDKHIRLYPERYESIVITDREDWQKGDLAIGKFWTNKEEYYPVTKFDKDTNSMVLTSSAGNQYTYAADTVVPFVKAKIEVGDKVKTTFADVTVIRVENAKALVEYSDGERAWKFIENLTHA